MLLILIYRSPIFWTIPFFTVLLAEVTSRGLGYLLAEAGVTINGQTGGDPAGARVRRGHRLRAAARLRYREELRRHDDKHEAIRIALGTPARRSSPPASTVMAALLVLILADVTRRPGSGRSARSASAWR